MSYSSRPSFLFIKVFMRGKVFDVNRVNNIASSVRVLFCKFPYLLSQLPPMLLMLNKGPTHLKGFRSLSEKHLPHLPWLKEFLR